MLDAAATVEQNEGGETRKLCKPGPGPAYLFPFLHLRRVWSLQHTLPWSQTLSRIDASILAAK
jgi:hypothetical protein